MQIVGDKLDPGVLVAFVGESLRTVAASLGVDPALLCRPLSPRQADAYACRLGWHPLEVWGMAWFATCRPEPFEEIDEGLVELDAS